MNVKRSIMSFLKNHRIKFWLQERIPIREVVAFLSKKEVPRGRYSFWYLFGGLTLFFFIIQFISGMLLALYYSPTPDSAYQSVKTIMTVVSFGWLIRSVHAWSANLMIASLSIHLLSVYFMQAYRRPREFMWFSGVILFFIVMGFAFTGYLLPWDTTSYFATQIGTEIPRSIPIVGDFLVSILRGGDYIAEESLKRLFTLHITILPLISTLLVFFHLILSQVHGTSIPPGTSKKGRSVPFYPNFIYRDAIAWSCAFLALCSLSILLPVHLGTKADPFASAPIGIKPEWYFLPLFETLRLLPPAIFHLNGEILVDLAVGIFGALFFCVPLLDTQAKNDRPSPVMRWTGIVTVAYVSVTIILAYLT